MPDVFEKYFEDFGKKVKDYYKLIRLDPAYKIFFNNKETISIPGSFEKILKTFENIEEGSSAKLKKFIKEAEINYSIAMNGIIYKPGFSIFELITLQTVKRVKYFITTIKAEVSKIFKNKKLKKILEFPILFLGAKPENTPAFYNIMNYADFKLGTWYPEDGMYTVIKAMVRLAEENGVKLISNQNVEGIIEENNKVIGVIANRNSV
jgi:phytoene desaturase